MLFNQYLFSNLHFLLTVFGSLVFFACGWLFLDSWTVGKDKKTPLIRASGFFFLAIVWAIHASTLENTLVKNSIEILKISALVQIILSLVTEPFLKPPKESINTTSSSTAALGLTIPSIIVLPISATLFLLTSIIYFVKATIGLEKQLKPTSYAFFFLHSPKS